MSLPWLRRVFSRHYGMSGLAAWCVASLCAWNAQAQLPQTRLYSLFPPGAAKGGTTEVVVTNGVDLEEVNKIVFSHPGITGAQKVNMVEGQPPQPVANTFTVTVSGDVPPGFYEARIAGKYGLSNPRTFVVGDLPEAVEVEPNNAREQAQAIPVNSLVNARSNGGADIDWFKVELKAGQRILCEALCNLIDSRMSAVLELYAPNGRMLMLRREKIPGPVIDFTAPADGEYLLKVYDTEYGGSNDHFYRLKVHTGPYIDFIYPPAGLPGTTHEFVVYGRNLPGGQPSNVQLMGQPLEQLKASVALPADPMTWQGGPNLRSTEGDVTGVNYFVTGPTGASNPVLVQFATATPVLEVEPNDGIAEAQKVTVPCEFMGQFQNRGDIDGLVFDAKAGEVFWIETYGERCGNSADPYLTVETIVKNDKGELQANRITALDESAPNIRPLVFDTLTADPAYRFQAPADGTFRVTVRDRYFESRGTPRLVYRLAIRPEMPDFQLVALPVSAKPAGQEQNGDPWELVLRRGENVAVDVMSYRQDGFNGVIDVTAEGLPEGVTCKGGSIGPGQNLVSLIFTTTEQAPASLGPIKIVGTARVDDKALAAAVTAADAALKAAVDAANKATGDAKPAADQKATEAQAAYQAAVTALDQAAKTLVRPAKGGTVVWNKGQGVPTISRVARQTMLNVIEEVAPMQLISEAPTKVDASQSRQILIPVKLIKRNGFDDNVNLQFVGQPQNVQVENKPIAKGSDSEVYRVFVQNNTAPGTYTLYLKSQATVAYRRNVEAADAAQKEKEAADKALADSTEENKKAQEAKVAADKKMVDTQAEAKKTTDAKAITDKAATDAAAALKTATDEKAAADKKAADADTAAKQAAEKAAQAKEAADKDANNADLAKAKEEADKAAADAAEAAKKAAEEKVNADKKFTDAEANAKKADEAKVAADKAAVDAAEAAKKAAEEKVVADKAAVDADAKLKAATAAKAAADKKATDTANASKPNNIQLNDPSYPIVITVHPAPATLAASAANGGALKKGEKLEVKVTVNRINGFMGPVTLSLETPPAVTGLKAAPVTVPADQKEGTLVIEAAGDATEGQLANVVVRAAMQYRGEAAVDQPVAINVVK